MSHGAKNLLEQVADAIRERKLFRRGERILVAVSGGVDSMVLLQLLRDLAAESGWKLGVAHFNHQLRGRASDADERLVRRKAAALGLKFFAGRGDVKAHAQTQGVSLEMAGRELRHTFLARTARRTKCPVIAVAHHADDQVELFFLRLLRGAGGEGIAGMKWSSASPANREVRIVRPLLEVGKVELTEFAHQNKIRFREDASNASFDLLRNRVRHELLPQLRKNFQPALNRTVLRLMEVVAAENAAVIFAARAWLAKPARRCAWDELSVGVQRQVVILQLQGRKILPDFDLIEFLRLQPGNAITIDSQQSLVRDGSGHVALVVPASRMFKSGESKLNLDQKPQVGAFAGLKVAWQLGPGPGPIRPFQRVGAEFFDAARVGHNIVLRHWRPGDRFQPIGMKAAVKLQDWFTNQKIPAPRRRELVVATTATGEIFWVESLRIGERFKLTRSTRQVLDWRWEARKHPKSCIAGVSGPC